MKTYVTKKPKCHFCSAEAEYDAKSIDGPWAYMCDFHYVQFGIGLGLGKGQKLLLKSEQEK